MGFFLELHLSLVSLGEEEVSSGGTDLFLCRSPGQRDSHYPTTSTLSIPGQGPWLSRKGLLILMDSASSILASCVTPDDCRKASHQWVQQQMPPVSGEKGRTLQQSCSYRPGAPCPPSPHSPVALLGHAQSRQFHLPGVSGPLGAMG